MPGQAKVTSVDALEAFRAALILFLSKARPTLEEISAEVIRTRVWLESDRQRYWDQESRRRQKDLEQAQQELFNARCSNLREVTASQQMAVRRAQAAVREAEEKRRLLKKWCREFDDRTAPMAKQVDQLHTFLATDMKQAVAELGQAVKTLEAYAAVAAPGTASNAAPATVPAAQTDPPEVREPEPQP